jgi:predicted Rossmann-fold nucleotide-binding protein
VKRSSFVAELNAPNLGERNRPRVIVCGGRDFTDRAFVFRKLDALLSKLKDPILVTGGQRGVDKLAGDWASGKIGMLRKVFHPDKEKHGSPACYFARNQEMANYAAERKPSFCVAFPGGDGTADMVRRAKKAGLIVREIKR